MPGSARNVVKGYRQAKGDGFSGVIIIIIQGHKRTIPLIEKMIDQRQKITYTIKKASKKANVPNK